MNTKKQRPNISQPGVGILRRDLIKAVMDQYARAYKDGYYIECIALMESLIGDRLESLSNQLHGTSYSGYQPLGRTIQDITPLNSKLTAELIRIIDLIKSWSKTRNEAIHEMGKLEQNLTNTFDKRYKILRNYASEGKRLFRNLDKEIKRWRTAVKNGIIII